MSFGFFLSCIAHSSCVLYVLIDFYFVVSSILRPFVELSDASRTEFVRHRTFQFCWTFSRRCTHNKPNKIRVRNDARHARQALYSAPWKLRSNPSLYRSSRSGHRFCIVCHFLQRFRTGFVVHDCLRSHLNCQRGGRSNVQLRFWVELFWAIREFWAIRAIRAIWGVEVFLSCFEQRFENWAIWQAIRQFSDLRSDSRTAIREM